ncbi:MAG: energy transducer TonB, partial [Thioalkalivibrio sp.]|nr:energy transducer TonB [Thioalkalivibrio sp.]
PEPEPEPVPKARPEPRSPAPDPRSATTAPPQAQAAQEHSPEDQSGPDTHRDTGGDPALLNDYMAQLRAWLERHRQYPRQARMRRMEGTVVVRFVLDRSGDVLSYEIEDSSGHGILDREVELMIERAQPFPAIPSHVERSPLEVVVPVQFTLR